MAAKTEEEADGDDDIGEHEDLEDIDSEEEPPKKKQKKAKKRLEESSEKKNTAEKSDKKKKKKKKKDKDEKTEAAVGNGDAEFVDNGDVVEDIVLSD